MHEVRPVALRDVEHLGAHFHARRRHGEVRSSKPSLLLQLLEDRHRFGAGRVVVVEIGDLLALQVAAQLVLDERRPRRQPATSRSRRPGTGTGYFAPFAAAAEPKPGEVPGILSCSSRGFSACACGVPQISVDTMPICLWRS